MSILPGTPEPVRWRPNARGLIRFAIVFVSVVSTIVFVDMFFRLRASAELVQRTEEQAILTVGVVHAEQAPDRLPMTLPGTTRALSEAGIFARTSGYIKSWTTDLGGKVTKGQVLAELDTPEVDEQLRQGEADLVTIEANSALAQATADRWKTLLSTGSVSRQAADEKIADARAKAAQVNSARANVQRLRQLQKFKLVTAPFDGVVTARRVDVGALVNAGSGAGAELFRIADTSRLRVFAQVPQTSAGLIKPGVKAELRASDRPGRVFQATVVRDAEVIDPAARTLLVELETDNSDGALFAGAYVEVRFNLAVSDRKLILPINAVLFRPDGPIAVTVGADGKIVLKPVQIGLDFGNRVEIISGISADDQIVVNPPDSIAEGRLVRIGAPTKIGG